MSTNAADERPITSLWWLPVVFGAVTFGVGVFFVVSPHETLSTFTVIAGIFLLVDGVLAIFGSILGNGEGRSLPAIIGVLSANRVGGGLTGVLDRGGVEVGGRRDGIGLEVDDDELAGVAVDEIHAAGEVGAVVEHGREGDFALVTLGGQGALHRRGGQAARGQLDHLGGRCSDAGLSAHGRGDRREVLATGEGDELHDAVHGGPDVDGRREVEADRCLPGI
jgi:hypothetical protein